MVRGPAEALSGAIALDDRTLEVLEFPAVIDRLARLTAFSGGREAALALRPVVDRDEVVRRQRVTAEAVHLGQLGIEVLLGGARDIRSLAERAERGQVLTAAELLDVADASRAAVTVQRALVRLQPEAPLLANIAGGIGDIAPVSALINGAIDDSGTVRNDASPELRQIRHEVGKAHDQLQQRMQTMAASSSLRPALQEPIVTIRDGRYVLPVKSEMRSAVRGVVHDSSASGATVYIEPMAVVELGNRWRELQVQEQHEVDRILREISEVVGSTSADLIDAVNRLSRIDLAVAKGKLAKELDAQELHATGSQSWLREAPGELRLVQARHPLLAGDVVANTIIVGGEHHALLITGPNTGGKTVALKTAGLLTLMALAGLPIPADKGSTVPIYESVFADIGDEQSIEQSLSTFSGHITSIISVLERANEQSLVLLDELGAGTDPTEGAALAVAIVDRLLARGAALIATTHHSELKLYAHRTPKVVNASVEFDLQSLSPTYRLTIGLAGQSNALAIAANLGMPREVIESARTGLSSEDRELESMLGELRGQLATAEERAAQATADAERAETLRREREQELERLASEATRLREDARIRVRDELRDVRRLLEKSRKEIESARLEQAGEDFRRAEAAAERLRPVPVPEVEEREPLPMPGIKEQRFEDLVVVPGAVVWLRGVSVAGEALSEPDERGEFEVQLGALRTRVRLEQVRATGEPSRDTSGRELTVPMAPWSPSEIEVRGQRLDEALPVVEQFLDAASRAGHGRVRVIHGRGTGTLRRAVREMFDRHPLVTGYETAEPRDGGEGVTVVTLAGTR
jgi:DNA mismatch repair protein MutS2